MNSWGDTARTFALITVELATLFLAVSFAVVMINRKLGPKRIQSWLEGRSILGSVKGAALGALTPFCSCSTIPMLVGLLKAGVPFGTAGAFLVGSPLLNPIILGVIGLLFGWTTAFSYAAVAFVGTVLIGSTWQRLGLGRYVRRVRVEGGEDHSEPWAGFRAEAPAAWRRARTDFRRMLIPMLLGVSIGAIIYGAVPETLLVNVADSGNLLAVLIAAVVGIPLYVRVETALPIGLALISAGVGVGPVFALIIGGAGASIPEVSMLTAIFKPRLVAIFVGSILAVAVAGGMSIPLLAG